MSTSSALVRRDERDVLFTVFMEGTSNSMRPITTQIGIFAALCEATELPDQLPAELPHTPGHYKVAFNGCGVSHGFWGTVVAHGLREQCAVVQCYVRSFTEAGLRVTINFLGLSRGGIGGLYLAQVLNASFGPEELRLNLCLFDPVPGNVIWMARFLDVGGNVMNANLAMDVSSCCLFGDVLALYPHQPLPAIALHAPLLARYPDSGSCTVEEEVILGCHQGALWSAVQADCCLSFRLIRDFLVQRGTLLSLEPQQNCRGDRRVAANAAERLNVSDEKLAQMLDNELLTRAPTSRDAHAATPSARVVRHPSGDFLNRTHQRLLAKLGRARPGSGRPSYMLEIVVGAAGWLDFSEGGGSSLQDGR